MKVSVICPTYNRLTLLERAIASFLKQDYANSELIVLDNGTTDGTTAYLHGLENPRIKVIRREVNSPLGSLNVLWNAADGDLICQLHDDDELTESSISDRVKAFEVNEFLEVVYAGWYTQDANGNETGMYIGQSPNPFRILRHEYINFTTLMWKNSIKEKFMFDEELMYYVDWHFKIRCALECCLAAIKQPVMMYTVHPGSETARCRTEGKNIAEENLMRNKIRNIYGI